METQEPRTEAQWGEPEKGRPEMKVQMLRGPDGKLVAYAWFQAALDGTPETTEALRLATQRAIDRAASDQMKD